MILDAAQTFSLPYAGSVEEALAFLRDPARSLARVRFLRGLHVNGDLLRAELLVNVPLLGEVALPFQSRLLDTPDGARLLPQPLNGRLWAELSGDGAVSAAGGVSLHYALQLRAHLELPQAEKWGGVAFEKMLRETARRTLDRVTGEFPAGVLAAMDRPA